MPGPLLSEVLPDLVEELAFLLRERGAEPLGDQLRALHIESICDCGDENCASFATAPEVKVASTVELQATEGFVIVDLNAAILEVTALTRSEAIKTGVTVSTQLADELPRIQCDQVQLQQVMLNLIVNAIQSMSGVEDGNRELHISTVSIEPEGVRVAVRDTGHGLRPESLPRLFEPFYTTKPEGMGMGLSICRSIIEAHGGRLWATRCEPRGALFQFTIPAD